MAQFHAWFSPYIPDLLPDDAAGAMFSMKFERYTVGVERGFIDLVFTTQRRVAAIPFIVAGPQGLIFPRAADALGAGFLAASEDAVGRWLSSAQPANARLEILGNDPDLVSLCNLRGAPGDPVAPGIASHQSLSQTITRYQHAATRAGGRIVLDLNPLLGFGTRTLRQYSRELRALSGGHDALAARLGLWPLDRQLVARPYGLCIALDAPPQRVAEFVERGRAAGARDALIFLTSRGEAGAQALRPYGEPQMMFRPGAQASGPLGEYALWLEPPGRVATVPEAPQRPAGIAVSASPLRVLFVLRPSAETTFGGDVVQVQRTAQALRDRGHRVQVTTESEPQTDGYDVVHLTNLTTGAEGLVQARAVRSFAGPIVFMPIFIDHSDETVWGMGTASALFYSIIGEADLAERLDQLAKRIIAANNVPPPPARPEMYVGYTAMQRELMSYVDFIVANAYSEVHRIYRYLEPNVPFAIAPSAADAHIYRPDARAAFVEKYGLADFILTTGRIEPRKNQLLLLWATRAMHERKLVIIGTNNDPLYGFFAQVYSRDNVVFLPQMPEQELAGAYAAARLFVLPSWDEVVSMSALNAALSGPSLVLTRNGYEHEYFRDDALYCDPADAASIEAAIESAWQSHEVRAERRAALIERVRREYTWERSAEATENAYYRVLAHNPRGARRQERHAG